MEKIGGKFEKAEQKEGEPKISYHFFYAPHGTAKDIENLEKAFGEADIYVPEAYAWGPSGKSLLEAVSNGLAPEKALESIWGIKNKSARFHELEILYNSKKPILLADIPATEIDLIKKDKAGDTIFQQAFQYFAKGELQQALKELRSALVIHAEVDEEREEKIKVNLEKQIKTFLVEHPEYSAKKELQILIQLGVLHTNLYHKFKKENLLASREFSQPIIVYLFLGEALRRIRFKKEIDNTLLAKGLMGSIMYNQLIKITDDDIKVERAARKLVAPLELQDIEQISKDFHLERIIDIRKYFFKKFKIRVPKSEEEMDEVLGIEKEEKI